jgi:diguanylate cyclase (GGDEF)-like protein
MMDLDRTKSYVLESNEKELNYIQNSVVTSLDILNGVTNETANINKPFNFNFSSIIEDLDYKYKVVDQINIYKSSDYLLELTSNKNIKITGSLENIKKSIEKNEILNVKGNIDGDKFLYRYIPYKYSEFSNEIYDDRIIEIVYNDHNIGLLLYELKIDFGKQLLVTVLISVLISRLIALILSRPMHFAFHDSLTGLKNREAYNILVRKKILNKKKSAGILLLDLDNFKEVNDTYGHYVGDVVLVSVANVIKNSLRKEDVAVRFGGDEFLLILPNISNEEDLKQIGDRLVKDIYDIRNGPEKDLLTRVFLEKNVTASAGGCFYSDNSYKKYNGDELYKLADISLYESKEYGKNNCIIYNKINFIEDDLCE